MIVTIADLAEAPIWVAWQGEKTGTGKVAKIPKISTRKNASTTNPNTWATRSVATVRAGSLAKPEGIGGVGIVLGREADAGMILVGFDLDTCRSANGSGDHLTEWAQEVVDGIGTYTELSPSETGVKCFFLMPADDVATLVKKYGPNGAKWKKGDDPNAHLPAIELHLGDAYFTLTDARFGASPEELRVVDLATVVRVIDTAVPLLLDEDGGGAPPPRDNTPSGIAWHIGHDARRAGRSFDDFREAVLADDVAAAWYRGKGAKKGEDHLTRIWNKLTVDPVKKSPPLRIVDPRGFHGQPVPDRQWIVRDWIPCGVATALYGPGGFGKSLLAQQLMTAVALGKPWLGVPVEPVRSIGLFCEDDIDELRRRQAAINSQLYGCALDALGGLRWLPRLGDENLLVTFDRAGRAALTPLFEQLREAALDFGAKLVVIDTVADTFGGNQNDAGQVRQFVQFCLARLAREIGGAVLACAHPSRAGISSGTGESGSVQWDAAFRSRLYLGAPKAEGDDERADPDARLLTRKKANYSGRGETIELHWHAGVLSATGASGDRPDAATVFLKLLDKVTTEGQKLSHNSRAGNYAPKVFTDRADREGCRRRDFERALQALLEMGEIVIADYGPPSARRSRIARSQPMLFAVPE